MNDATVREYRVRGGVRPRAFAGVLLAEVSTVTPERPRWIEITLYRDWDVHKNEDGVPLEPLEPIAARGYVLHVVGRSVVYHQLESVCNTGVPKQGVQLEGFEPCRRCNPGLLNDRTEYDVEEDRYAVHTCATAEDVITRLHDPRAPASAEPDSLSAPARRLLRLAAEEDEGIAAVMNAEQWLLANCIH